MLSPKITNSQYIQTIELLKATDIFGCVTGSSLWAYDTDISDWDSDVDIFVYSEMAFMDAVAQVKALGWHLATDGERWKWKRTKEHGLKKTKGGQPMCTLKLDREGWPQVNISIKPHQESVCDVITAFDQTCIMAGWDIKKGIMLDFRDMWTGDKWTSMLNPLRDQDYEAYSTKTWLRQTDRLQKYHDRGFDVSLATQGYITMIDETLKIGNLFPQSEASVVFFEETTSEFAKIRDSLKAFLKEEYEIDE